MPASRKLLRIKLTPDSHLTYSENGGNLGLVLKMKNIACISILLEKHVKYTYLLVSDQFWLKYYHFCLLCKQMDIYLRKVYIVRKVTSVQTFFGLIQYLSAWHILHATSSKNIFLKRISCDQLYQFWSSCPLHVQIKHIVEILKPFLFGIIVGQFCENKFLFQSLWNRLWALIANACLPRDQVCKIWECH